MNKKKKLAFDLLVTLTFFGMVCVIVVQHQASKRFQPKERALQQQLDALTAQDSKLIAEEARLLKLIKAQQAGADTSQGQDQFSELLRLRGEVGRLLLENRDAQQWRRANMQSAQARLPEAEAQLTQVSELHSNNVVSEGELRQASFQVDLLKAEASGDKALATQIRLRRAEEELAQVTQLHENKAISGEEVTNAQFAVELLKAEVNGDESQAAQVRLRQAEYELARATELRKRMLISQGEYDAATRKVEAFRAGAK